MKLEMVRGTLDMLVLRSLMGGPRHGYDVAAWLRQTTGGALTVEEGSLYPALHRLARKGWTEADWGTSEKGQRAKFYTITPDGRDQLQKVTARWSDFVSAVTLVLNAPLSGDATAT